MRIRCGYRIAHDCSQPVPMLLALSVHPSRESDLLTQPQLTLDPPVDVHRYIDDFGNICHRVLAPVGRTEMTTSFDIEDSGLPDPVIPEAKQLEVQDLADGGLGLFARQPLLRDRQTVQHRLVAVRRHRAGVGPRAGDLRLRPRPHHLRLRACAARQDGVGRLQRAAGRVPRLCPSCGHPVPVHEHTRALLHGVSRRHRHPAGGTRRWDFSAWFEAYLEGPDGGRWFTFDARHNFPRIGRILMARGRDATDVALVTTFGPAWLSTFEVITDEIKAG